MKTSAIFIAAGETTAVYRTLDEVPPALRSRLLRSTAGRNAGVVIIADRRGAIELARAQRDSAGARPSTRRRLGLKQLAALGLSGAVGFVLWLVYQSGL